MESHEVLRNAIEKMGVKALAAKLKLSAALIYKWCQPPQRGASEGSGARNPLDRLWLVYRETHDEQLVQWLCHKAGGYFVKNPTVQPGEREEELLGTTQRLVERFGGLLGEVSRSIENDGIINKEEAARIRTAWDDLKSHTEQFVVACEHGFYHEEEQPGR